MTRVAQAGGIHFICVYTLFYILCTDEHCILYILLIRIFLIPFQTALLFLMQIVSVCKVLFPLL